MKTFARTVGIAGILAYIAICFGMIAKKHGKNPVKYGLLSIVSPLNMVLLGYWAFSDYEKNGPERRNPSQGDDESAN